MMTEWEAANAKLEKEEKENRDFACLAARSYIFSDEACCNAIIELKDIGMELNAAIQLLVDFVDLNDEEIKEKYGHTNVPPHTEFIFVRIEDVYNSVRNNITVAQARKERLEAYIWAEKVLLNRG
jgi:hypothetical protein